MMRKTFVPLFMLPLLFAACSNNKLKTPKADIAKDTLSYTYQYIRERAADCKTQSDSGCTVAQIQYPVFAGDDALTDTVAARLLNLFLPGNRPDKDLTAQAKNFIAGYEQFYKSKKNKDRPKVPFSLKSYGRVLRQDSSLITMEIGGYSFAGGAHGNSLTFFFNWDTEAKKTISLNDIFTANYLQPLTAAAEKIFRKQENLKDTSSLARDYFFKDNKFALNNNFLITPIGIRFLYNQYEIKPYAAGKTDLFVPYDKIRQLLKPHTVLSQYIKH